MAQWLRWQRGRRESGYRKLLLARSRWPLPFDAWLLHFPTDSSVPPHRDPNTEGRHVRLNLILRHATRGGDFVCDDPIVDRPRLKIFRSDVSDHAVTRVEAGSRWVLSVGVLLPR